MHLRPSFTSLLCCLSLALLAAQAVVAAPVAEQIKHPHIGNQHPVKRTTTDVDKPIEKGIRIQSFTMVGLCTDFICAPPYDFNHDPSHAPVSDKDPKPVVPPILAEPLPIPKKAPPKADEPGPGPAIKGPQPKLKRRHVEYVGNGEYGNNPSVSNSDAYKFFHPDGKLSQDSTTSKKGLSFQPGAGRQDPPVILLSTGRGKNAEGEDLAVKEKLGFSFCAQCDSDVTFWRRKRFVVEDTGRDRHGVQNADTVSNNDGEDIYESNYRDESPRRPFIPGKGTTANPQLDNTGRHIGKSHDSQYV